MNTSGGFLTAENTTIAAMDIASITIPNTTPGDSFLDEVSHIALGGPGNGTFA